MVTAFIKPPSPGAFEINDLYATGSAGDLYVNIKESDGSEQNFVVPFASLAILQREGQLDYALSSGRTRSGSSDDKEYNFIQSSRPMAPPATSLFILVSSRRKINTPTCC